MRSSYKWQSLICMGCILFFISSCFVNIFIIASAYEIIPFYTRGTIITIIVVFMLSMVVKVKKSVNKNYKHINCIKKLLISLSVFLFLLCMVIALLGWNLGGHLFFSMPLLYIATSILSDAMRCGEFLCCCFVKEDIKINLISIFCCFCALIILLLGILFIYDLRLYNIIPAFEYLGVQLEAFIDVIIIALYMIVRLVHFSVLFSKTLCVRNIKFNGKEKILCILGIIILVLFVVRAGLYLFTFQHGFEVALSIINFVIGLYGSFVLISKAIFFSKVRRYREIYNTGDGSVC